MSDKIVLLDGHSILNRAFTAYRICPMQKDCTRTPYMDS